MEDKIYLHSLPYFDRLDYVSMLMQEHAYCLAIEKLLNTTNYSATFVQVRTLYDELTRILNHLLAISCHALDVGSMSPVFWAFEEREKIMEFYERVSGARMHAAFYRPNEINISVISKSLLIDILDFTKICFTTLTEIQNILIYNKIWKQRLINIGIINKKNVISYGLTGVMARSVGLKRDVRVDLFDTYANYYYLNFKNFLGLNGDCYDRFLIRMNEMTESLNIITQIISKMFSPNIKNKTNTLNSKKLKNFSNNNSNLKISNNYMKILNFNFDSDIDPKYHYIEESKIIKSSPYNKNLPIQPYSIDLELQKFNSKNIKFSNNNLFKLKSQQLLTKINKKILNNNKYNNDFKYMENIINHFKYWSEGFNVKNNITTTLVESGKGEFGVTLLSDNSNKPYRCKIRSPAYHHLQFLPTLVKGHLLADLVTLVGTIDIVFGEIDR